MSDIKRFLTAAIGILILIPVCIFYDYGIWAVMMTVMCAVSTYEIMHCIGLHRKVHFAVPFYVFSLLPVVTWLLYKFKQADMNLVILNGVILMFISEFISILVTKNHEAGEKIYSAIALVSYVVVSFTALVMSSEFVNDGYLFVLIFLGAWGSDTFAFLAGKLLGKHKLCPEISPKKTIEGSIGGILGTSLLFTLFAVFWVFLFHKEANIWLFALLGALLSVMGQLGDVFASSVKRYFGIKDFGTLFPGHGGALDRFDSTLAIALALFFIFNVCKAMGSQYLIS